MGALQPEGRTGTGEEPSFDARLERLEGIVKELELGGLGLEPAIERYQEGIELLKQCHRTLEGFRRRVEELTQDASGALRPFDGDPDFEA
jgi:exodeoxyribonuclease VII small subunit